MSSHQLHSGLLTMHSEQVRYCLQSGSVGSGNERNRGLFSFRCYAVACLINRGSVKYTLLLVIQNFDIDLVVQIHRHKRKYRHSDAIPTKSEADGECEIPTGPSVNKQRVEVARFAPTGAN